eukprot:1432887-Pyramimonas_sp.AAC.1
MIGGPAGAEAETPSSIDSDVLAFSPVGGGRVPFSGARDESSEGVLLLSPLLAKGSPQGVAERAGVLGAEAASD